MKLYVVLLAAFVVAAGFIVVRYTKEQQKKASHFYALKERTGALAAMPEAKKAREQFDEWTKIARTNPADIKSRVNLAALLIQEARVTGDYMYYDMAAMQYVKEILELEPQNFEGLTFQSLLYLSQHHFSDGLAIAEKARQQNPDNAFVHGILVDGNVETGNYEKAVEEADRMMSIRPDIRSYSRVSYLREIYGDYPGAIEAMKLAVDAGMPGDESTEWARVHLGNLYMIAGDESNAAMQYALSLQQRPDYAFALAGQARLELAKGRYQEAIDGLNRAILLVNDYSFREDLADAYALSGRKDRSDSIIHAVIGEMSEDAKMGNQDEQIGHYADRELAQLFLKTADTDKALEHALAEYNRRPGNIDVNETLAWVYYNKGQYAKAIPYLEVALKTKTRNPVVLCHAALIYAKAGQRGLAKTMLADGLSKPMSLPRTLRDEALGASRQL